MAKRLKNIHLDEVSLVDNPANKGARVALFKRGPNVDALVEVCKGMFDDDATTDFREALADELRMQRIGEVHEKMFPLMDALRESIMTSAAELSGPDRDNRIRENVEAFLQAVQQKLDGADMDKTLETFRKNAPTNPAGSPGNPTSKGDDMTIEELQKKLGELEDQVAEITKERDAEKAERESLTKAVEDAGVKVEKADDGTVTATMPEPTEKNSDDEFIEFDGEKIAKSALPEPVLKRLEAQNERLAKMEREREAESLRKRAEAEVPNLAGDADTKAALIKAVDGIEDEDARKAVSETLKAADAATKAAFLEAGKTSTGEADANDPAERLEKMAQDSKGEDETIEQARARVAKSAEGRELRKQIGAERRTAN